MLDSGEHDHTGQISPAPVKRHLGKAYCWAVCLLAFSLGSCKNDLEKVNDLFTEEEVQYDVAFDPVLTYTEKGETRLEITAAVLRSYNQNPRKTEFPEGLQVAFFNGRRNTSNLTADYGVNQEQSKELLVRGNVVFENDKGEMLETDELTWVEKDKKIHTDAPIRITTPDEVITGVGLDADEDFSNYTIRRIQGIVNVEE